MKDITNRIIQFRDDRNWKQFHNLKDLALSLSLESSELLELFQWKSSEEALQMNFNRMKEELADVLIYSLILCNDLNINPEDIIMNKLEQNNKKYPVDKSYGSKNKYTDL